jgi:hydroxymethylglutaryl-CoA reductase (NADPH)
MTARRAARSRRRDPGAGHPPAGHGRPAPCDALPDPEIAQYRGQIEHFAGLARLPFGLAGPLRVQGQHADGEYRLPLATTEATLVASYARGCRLITVAGGCRTAILDRGVTRSPGFAFGGVLEACGFVDWVRSIGPELACIADATTRHGRLVGVEATVEANHVYLDLRFTTGDAAGQNMVTLASEAVCRHLVAHAPVPPRRHFLEANHSGDKKASARSLSGVRGYRVAAEVTLPDVQLRRRLKADAALMCDYWRMAVIGGVLSGTVGVQGHYANGLAALYLACGQDVACVAESAVGVTRLELTDDGQLYAAVTLPNLIVGTVGGGTGLPTQRACLEGLGLAGAGHAAALAEVCAGLALAGELSLIGALCAGEFAAAHRAFARRRRPPAGTGSVAP